MDGEERMFAWMLVMDGKGRIFILLGQRFSQYGTYLSCNG
jgi:hypothetical protein